MLPDLRRFLLSVGIMVDSILTGWHPGYPKMVNILVRYPYCQGLESLKDQP